MTVALQEIVDVLGGKSVLRRPISTDREMALAVSRGLPGATLRALRRALNLTTKEFGEAILIPERTLLAHQDRATLPTDESDRVYRLARVSAAAFKAFASVEKAARWLRKPNRSLGGVAPLEAVRTSIGIRLVEEALGRIAFGTVG